jgi:hypothetical protein
MMPVALLKKSRRCYPAPCGLCDAPGRWTSSFRPKLLHVEKMFVCRLLLLVNQADDRH